MACRNWSLPDGTYFTGLCSMTLLPETANPTKSCGLCVKPMPAVSNSPCGCPSPLVELPKTYMLTVDEGPLGRDPTRDEWYGTHMLFGTCGGFTGYFTSEFSGFGGWSILASFSPFLSSGKYLKNTAVQLISKPTVDSISIVIAGVWAIPIPIPACDNSDRFSTKPVHNRTSADDNPASNPFYPNVYEDHFSLSLRQM